MRTILALLISLAFAASLAGCGEDSPLAPMGSPPSSGSDLDDEYGGFTFDDELPDFGEPALFANELLQEDAEYEDLYEDDPTVAGMGRRPGARIFTLRINWGMLLRPDAEDSSDCRDQEMTYDWDGSLSVDRGAIILKRTILFEPGDYIHERENRRTLEWTSTTGPHYDGILVKIIDPPPMGPPDSTGTGGPDTAPNHVTFRTPQYSRTFTMDELVRISEVIYVNRCGVGVAFNGFLEPRDPCPHGFLAGIWRPVPPDTTYAGADTTNGRCKILGHFYGNWIQWNGVLAGRVKGVYGINSAGRQVFFGKYIDFSGRFRGILRGAYGSMSLGPFTDTYGWFEGEWISRSRAVRGHLKGHWAAAPNRPIGLFHGKWSEDCRNWPTDDGLAL